jgi:hypothetical protein
MQIVIPTYRRTQTQKTFKQLPAHWKARTIFVADEEDTKRLHFNFRDTGATFTVVPEEITSIAKKRAWIIKTFKHEHILMLDDDLRFDSRIEGTQKLLVAKPHEVDFHLNKIEKKFEEGFRHLGISPRQGNNRLEEEWVPNTRMMYSLGYHLPTLREHCELGRIETREDFDYNLQLLKKGFENRVYSHMTTGQDQYNADGGCSLQRTVDASNEDAEQLAALHPGLVKVTQKEYTTSVPRKEVVVYWKKALQQSKEKAA